MIAARVGHATSKLKTSSGQRLKASRLIIREDEYYDLLSYGEVWTSPMI